MFHFNTQYFLKIKILEKVIHIGSNDYVCVCVFSGQQVVEEILDAQRPGCPPEYFNIDLPQGYGYDTDRIGVLPLLRSRYDMRTGFSPNVPRQQVRYLWVYQSFDHDSYVSLIFIG